MRSLIIFLFCASVFLSGGEGKASSRESLKDSSVHACDTVDCYILTDLGAACYRGDLGEVRRMIEQGVDRSACMTDEIFEYDAIYAATCWGHKDILVYLISLGDDVNRIYDENGTTLLSIACINSYVDIAGILIDAGAKVNGVGPIGGDYTRYPIMDAVWSNDARLVRLLIDHNVDINVSDGGGYGPLDAAREKQNEAIIDMITRYMARTTRRHKDLATEP